MRYKACACSVTLAAFFAGGCGGDNERPSDVSVTPAERVIPSVTGMSLADARRLLDRRGVGHEVVDEGLGPVLAEENWTVCEQWPEAGQRARSVELYVEHFCDEYEEDDDDDS